MIRPPWSRDRFLRLMRAALAAQWFAIHASASACVAHLRLSSVLPLS